MEKLKREEIKLKTKERKRKCGKEYKKAACKREHARLVKINDRLDDLRSLLNFPPSSKKNLIACTVQYVKMLTEVTQSTVSPEQDAEASIANTPLSSDEWKALELKDNIRSILPSDAQSLPLPELLTGYPYLKKLLTLTEKAEERDISEISPEHHDHLASDDAMSENCIASTNQPLGHQALMPFNDAFLHVKNPNPLTTNEPAWFPSNSTSDAFNTLDNGSGDACIPTSAVGEMADHNISTCIQGTNLLAADATYPNAIGSSNKQYQIPQIETSNNYLSETFNPTPYEAATTSADPHLTTNANSSNSTSLTCQPFINPEEELESLSPKTLAHDLEKFLYSYCTTDTPEVVLSPKNTEGLFFS